MLFRSVMGSDYYAMPPTRNRALEVAGTVGVAM